jgi:hypothetical protein
MNIQKRTCANCASFYPETAGAAPECWNAVSFIEHHGTPQEKRLAPGPGDVCQDHATHEEDAARSWVWTTAHLAIDHPSAAQRD